MTFYFLKAWALSTRLYLNEAIVKQRGAPSYPPKEGAMSKLLNGISDINTF